MRLDASLHENIREAETRVVVLFGLGIVILVYYASNLLVAVLLAYFGSGLFWYYRYYLAKPAAHRFSTFEPAVIVLWPLVSYVYAHTDPRLLHHPEPFCVVYGGPAEADGSRHAVFVTYEEALNFARLISSETGMPASVFDMAGYGSRFLAANATGVMSVVSVKGEIESICLVN